MQYALLLYASEAGQQGAGEAAPAAIECEREAFSAELARNGQRRSFYSLAQSASATTLRRRDGTTVLCDGPLAETREQLVGLLLIEARDLDEAIAIARRAPDAKIGSVEIRPVRESA